MNIKYPLLLDGGLSNELESRGCDLNHKLWSARLLDSDIRSIIQAHMAYLEAGAKCLITASYQASIPGFMDYGFTKDEAEQLILRSVWAAEEAIKESGNKEVYIAASIGPFGAYLGDGSEYHGNYGINDATLKQFHEERIQLLGLSNADFFACETIPSLQEAKVLCEILNDANKQAWVSFSCKDEIHLNDGTPIRECAKLFAKHPKVFAIGVNCTKPEYISSLIQELRAVPHSKKIVVYPNSGETYEANTKSWSGEATCVLLSKEWLELGADIIGGCCRVGPEHIKSIASVLDQNSQMGRSEKKYYLYSGVIMN
jgi:homocysteine S-methyltransferase